MCARVCVGNYACQVAAVSGTGMGEQFIRHVVAYDVCARMKYSNPSASLADGQVLQHAAERVVHGTLRPGDGGVIAVDAAYNIVMDFNSPGMYRGACDYKGRWEVAVFK